MGIGVEGLDGGFKLVLGREGGGGGWKMKLESGEWRLGDWEDI